MYLYCMYYALLGESGKPLKKLNDRICLNPFQTRGGLGLKFWSDFLRLPLIGGVIPNFCMFY